MCMAGSSPSAGSRAWAIRVMPPLKYPRLFLKQPGPASGSECGLPCCNPRRLHQEPCWLIAGSTTGPGPCLNGRQTRPCDLHNSPSFVDLKSSVRPPETEPLLLIRYSWVERWDRGVTPDASSLRLQGA